LAHLRWRRPLRLRLARCWFCDSSLASGSVFHPDGRCTDGGVRSLAPPGQNDQYFIHRLRNRERDRRIHCGEAHSGNSAGQSVFYVGGSFRFSWQPPWSSPCRNRSGFLTLTRNQPKHVSAIIARLRPDVVLDGNTHFCGARRKTKRHARDASFQQTAAPP